MVKLNVELWQRFLVDLKQDIVLVGQVRGNRPVLLLVRFVRLNRDDPCPEKVLEDAHRLLSQLL